jgi:hypothetical protein
MENEFVTYDQALALKELGFDEPCLLVYHQKKLVGVTNHEASGFRLPLISNKKLGSLTCTAPLYQQAFRFFREKYKIEATTSCFYNKRLDIPYEERQYHCYIIRDGVTSKGPKYKTYEEAEKACLDKLIEICKTK